MYGEGKRKKTRKKKTRKKKTRKKKTRKKKTKKKKKKNKKKKKKKKRKKKMKKIKNKNIKAYKNQNKNVVSDMKKEWKTNIMTLTKGQSALIIYGRTNLRFEFHHM